METPQRTEEAKVKTQLVDAILRKACAGKPASTPASYERVRGNLGSMPLSGLQILGQMVESCTSVVIYPAILRDLAA
jgi:hypothetical protein